MTLRIRSLSALKVPLPLSLLFPDGRNRDGHHLKRSRGTGGGGRLDVRTGSSDGVWGGSGRRSRGHQDLLNVRARLTHVAEQREAGEGGKEWRQDEQARNLRTPPPCAEKKVKPPRHKRAMHVTAEDTIDNRWLVTREVEAWYGSYQRVRAPTHARGDSK